MRGLCFLGEHQLDSALPADEHAMQGSCVGQSPGERHRFRLYDSKSESQGQRRTMYSRRFREYLPRRANDLERPLPTGKHVYARGLIDDAGWNSE